MSADPLAPLRARFRDQAAAEAKALILAATAGDGAGVERIAHRMAGAAGMFGFPEVQAAAAAVDAAFAAGRAPDADRINRLVAALEAAVSHS